MQTLDYDDLVARSFSKPIGIDDSARDLVIRYLVSSEIPLVEFLQLDDNQKSIIIAPLFNFLLQNVAPLGTLSFLVDRQGSTFSISTGD